VLSISGGNFSPKSQKLPFSVTSVDGDSYLLYYASIDLAGNSSSNKFRGQLLKRGLRNDDSQSVKSRFRIPMKGRIQLVLIYLFHFSILALLSECLQTNLLLLEPLSYICMDKHYTE
jgi:hypothetical protein